jgi:PPOX class probable F420-dependent enzyme
VPALSVETHTLAPVTPLLALAEERFISLTTFRRSGEPVSTPVWVSRDGDALVVLTPAGSGKVRRLRNDPRVEIQPCGRFGKVAEGVEPLRATAEVREGAADVVRARATIRRTYPIESRLVLGIERLLERLRGRPRTPRLALHLTAA